MSTSTRRRQLLQLVVFGGILLAFASGAAAQQASPILERHEGDDYTRYELLAPESAQFKITYEVTAARTGARYYFNIIRKGSEASDEAVFDRMTGQPLPWKVVTGAEARAAGQANADLEADYIQVTLARPVPAGGETQAAHRQDISRSRNRTTAKGTSSCSRAASASGGTPSCCRPATSSWPATCRPRFARRTTAASP